MALMSIYFWGPMIKQFLLGFPFRSSRLSSTPHHSGQHCHFHIHHHKLNLSCLFLPFDPFFDFICDKKRLTTPAVKLSSSSPYSNSNSETLNFVCFLCCSLLSSSKEPLAVVQLLHIVLSVNRLNIHVYTKLLLT